VAIAGKGGKVKFDTENIAEMNSWSINPSAGEIDTTHFDSLDWKEFMGSLKEWTGSCEGNLVKGHVASVINKLGTEAELELKITATGGDITFSGNAIITSTDIDVPVDDKATISIDFRGTGSLSAS